MLRSLWRDSPPQPEKTTDRTAEPARRRGVTSLEYLAVISFILVALILAVQHLGLVTQGLFTNNAAATSKTVQN